jgi:hypothetical protein
MAKNNTDITPLMALSILALFVMMIPIIVIANVSDKTKGARAQVKPTATPKSVIIN